MHPVSSIKDPRYASQGSDQITLTHLLNGKHQQQQNYSVEHTIAMELRSSHQNSRIWINIGIYPIEPSTQHCSLLTLRLVLRGFLVDQENDLPYNIT